MATFAFHKNIDFPSAENIAAQVEEDHAVTAHAVGLHEVEEVGVLLEEKDVD